MRIMRDICIEWCTRQKVVNKLITGCQFSGRRREELSGKYNETIKNGKYGDCLFFTGEDVVAEGDESLSRTVGHDQNHFCFSFSKTDARDYAQTKPYTKIQTVDRAYNKFDASLS